jgi:hypothetical protein
MAQPPRKKVDPAAAKKQAFQKFQARRLTDDFEMNPSDQRATEWKNFLGERAQRLRGVLQSFQLLTNAKYPPGLENSLPFVHDVLQRLGLSLPEMPTARLCEWLNSPQGGRPVGWREVMPGLAQTAANDGRAALVLGTGPDVAELAAVVCPDNAASSANPTIIMVSNEFVLDPGTVLQGFRGQMVRYFANGQ